MTPIEDIPSRATATELWLSARKATAREIAAGIPCEQWSAIAWEART